MLLNGASIRSCITFAVQADGAEVSTVEGLAAGGELHPLQDEFWDKQGLQCGYCTPGMLMRAHGDPRAEPGSRRPSRCEAAIASNLCRCTGYQFITEAVLAAAARMRETEEVRAVTDHRPRGGSSPASVTTHRERRWVGQSIRRVEDPKFLRGQGGYIADLIAPGHAARRRAAQPARRTPGS